MKKIQVITVVLAMMFSGALLTACQSEKPDGGLSQPEVSQNMSQSDSSDKSDEEESEKDTSETAPSNTANWTIAEAIENSMHFDCVNTIALYTDGTKLYASNNAVLAERMLLHYTTLIADKGASPEIRQIRISPDQKSAVILDANGKLWFEMKDCFSEYKIKYFDFCKNSSTIKSGWIAAVTDEGKVVWSFTSILDPKVQEGLEHVKYISGGLNTIAYVKEDGTAGYFQPGQEYYDLEGWNDIEMVQMLCTKSGHQSVVGLKKDGTVVAETLDGEGTGYPEEILSWSGIVYLNADAVGNDFLAGMKSDGSFAYVLLEGGGNEKRCEEIFGQGKNVMAAGRWGSIAADGVLIGDAQNLVYGWDLTKPWEGNDAALREHLEEGHHIYAEKLDVID